MGEKYAVRFRRRRRLAVSVVVDGGEAARFGGGLCLGTAFS